MEYEICEKCGFKVEEFLSIDHDCIEVLQNRLDYIMDTVLCDTPTTEDKTNKLMSEVYAYADYKRS